MMKVNNRHLTFDVVVVGEINPDLILNGNVIPKFGQVEQLIEKADLVMGSSAVIVACGCARLGLKTAFIGKIGDDFFGHFMLNSMKSRGINVTGVVVSSEETTGLSVILSSNEDRSILTFPGSIPTLRFQEIDLSIIEQSRHLHLSSYFLLDQLRPKVPSLFAFAKSCNLTISLDTNYDPTGIWNGGLRQLLTTTDIFLPNETEALSISESSNLVTAINKLKKRTGIIAIKRGAKGAVAANKNSEPVFQNAPRVGVVDTVGAGDSFDAGFIYGFLNKWELDETLKFAVACGSISTQKPGGTDGQADPSEIKDFISRYF